MPTSNCPLEDTKLRALLTYYMKDLAGYAGLTDAEKKILNVTEFERLRAWAFHGTKEKKNAASQDPQAPQELLAQAPPDDREGARKVEDADLPR